MSTPLDGIGTALESVHSAAKDSYTKEKARVTKATQDFEAVFVGMMLKQMRKSIAGDSPLFGKSPEAKIYQDMMDENLANQISHTGSFGLARAMMKSLAHTLPPDPDAAEPASKP